MHPSPSFPAVVTTMASLRPVNVQESYDSQYEREQPHTQLYTPTLYGGDSANGHDDGLQYSNWVSANGRLQDPQGGGARRRVVDAGGGDGADGFGPSGYGGGGIQTGPLPSAGWDPAIDNRRLGDGVAEGWPHHQRSVHWTRYEGPPPPIHTTCQGGVAEGRDGYRSTWTGYCSFALEPFDSNGNGGSSFQHPVALFRPRSVVFVGPVEGGGSLDSYGAAVVDTNAQQQNPRTLYHPYPQHIVSNQPHHLEPSHGPRTTFSTATGTIASIATTSLSPHHLHSTFQHDNATFSISPLYSLQSTSTRQPAREPISVFDDTLHFAEIRQQRNDSFSRTFEPGHYPLASHQPHHHEGVHIPGQEPVFDPPGMESCSLENEDESAAALWQGIDNVQLFVMSSPSASSPSDYSSPDSSSPSSSPSSSSRSQEEILEEIQRECAEIEERYSSVSPPASQSPSTSRVRAPHSSKSRHNQSHSGTPTLQGPIKRSPRSSRSTNSASPFATSDRKKELNRMAAIKYRERRRQERESATGELTQLEARNRELLADYASVEAEIKYLKRLIAEINARTASSS